MRNVSFKNITYLLKSRADKNVCIRVVYVQITYRTMRPSGTAHPLVATLYLSLKLTYLLLHVQR